MDRDGDGDGNGNGNGGEHDGHVAWAIVIWLGGGMRGGGC